MIVYVIFCVFLTAISAVFSYHDTSYGDNYRILVENSSSALLPLQLQSTYGFTKCKDDKDCYYENSKCKDSTCDCLDGYILDGTFTKCLKVASSYNDKCTDNQQCSKYLSVGGTCDQEVCVCLEGYHYLHGRCYKTKGLNDACKDDAECFVNTDYNAAICDIEKRYCKCSEGYYQREYSTCRKLAKLGDKCILDSDCSIENSKCVKNNCVSRNVTSVIGHLYLTNNYTTKSADLNIEIGNDCTNDQDCNGIAHSYCNDDKKCTCERAHFPSTDLKFCIAEIGENCTKSNTSMIDYSVCSTHGKWTCDYNRVNLKNNRLCRKLTTEIGKQCQTKENCQLFGPRSDCVDRKCVCGSESHYVKEKSFCWINKSIGEKCEQSFDCYHPEGSPRTICKNVDQNNAGVKICSCPNGTEPSENKFYCIKTRPELYGYCEIKEDCKIKNSICNDKKCQCDRNYFESEGQCLAGLEASCKTNADCKSNNTICIQDICQCKEGFVGNHTNVCVSVANYHESCECDAQCSYKVKNSHCLASNLKEKIITHLINETKSIGICECFPGYYLHDESNCFKKRFLGESCSREGECFEESHAAVCRNGKCTCKPNFSQQNHVCKNEGNGSSSIKSWLTLSLLCTSLLIMKSLR